VIKLNWGMKSVETGPPPQGGDFIVASQVLHG
jgi:hypothetical protein